MPSRHVTREQRAVAVAIIARMNAWRHTDAELVLERLGALAHDETPTSVMRRLNPLTPRAIEALEAAGRRLQFPPPAVEVPVAPTDWQPRVVRSRRPHLTPGQLALRLEWGPRPVTIAGGAVELHDDAPLPHIERLRHPDRAPHRTNTARTMRGRLAVDRVGVCNLCGAGFERNTFGRPAVRCPSCRRQAQQQEAEAV